MSKMRSITGHFSTKSTPQSKPIPGSSQVANSAGGFSWAVDKWTRLNRFLILGTEGGSYYASEQKLTADNAKCVLDCVGEDGVRVVNTVVEISKAGRAPKNTPALFVLALAAKLGDEATKRAAYEALPEVARIGTHLFQFADAISAFGGFSSGTQRALARWYTGKDAARVAFQAVKYQQREGWSHRDILRLAKPKGCFPSTHDRANPETSAHGDVFHWITKGELAGTGEHTAIIEAFEAAKALGAEGDVSKARTKEIIKLITDANLPRECIPTQYLNEVAVWEALLDNGGRGMPMTAMIRNLGKMSAVGLLKPMSKASGQVVAALGNVDAIRKARVHPLQILVAMNIYRQGRGARGSLSWSPVSQVVDALDRAFYTAFESVETTGLRHLLALDISGSMGSPDIAGMPGVSPRVGSAAMALVTAAREPNHHIVGFTCSGGNSWGGETSLVKNHWAAPSGSKAGGWGGRGGLSELTISPRQRLDDVVRYVSRLPMGGTDCAIPMLYAQARGLEVDVFVVYTDSETWAGSIHPAQALQQYRRATGINAKLIVVGMVANNFTIADPNDAGMIDIVGFDTSAPRLMSEFAKGNL